MTFFVLAAFISCILFAFWERETFLGKAVSATLIIVMLMCLAMAFLISGNIHV